MRLLSEGPEPKNNKRIIWDHFTDTAMLIVLDLVLVAMLDGSKFLIPEMADAVKYIHFFAKWFVITSAAQFAFESFLDIASKGIVGRIIRSRGGPHA
jgi:hypothetical protein